MLATFSLLRREFFAYFLSPIAYVVLAVFLFVTGYRFFLTMDMLTASGPKGAEFPMQYMFGDVVFWVVFLVIPPLLTMRLFAEERSTGTLEMLMTAPLRDWQIVLCKYLACLAFYVVLWLPTLAYLPVLLDVDWATRQPRLDPWPVAASYLGMFFAGAMFLAIGLLVSSLVRSPLVAVLLALFLSLGFIVAGIWRPDLDTSSLTYRLLYFFSVPLHYSRDFSRGLIDSRPLVLYGSVALFCLFLTVRSLESRRWR